MNRHYNTGKTIDWFETIIPIPVWFNDMPFPIMNLEYMDLIAEIEFNSILDIMLVRDIEIIKKILIQKVDPINKPKHEKSIIDIFLTAKNIDLHLNNKIKSDVYKISNDLEKVQVEILDYNDFDKNTIKYPEQKTEIKLENCYRLPIDYFLSNESIFKKPKFLFKISNDGSLQDLVNSEDYIIDGGYGYSIPNIKDYPEAFTPDYNDSIFIENYRFSRNKINSIIANDKLKEVLLNIFPKITLDTPVGGTKAEILVSEIDMYGRITKLEFENLNGNKIRGTNYPLDITDTSDIKYIITGYNAEEIKIYFNLFPKNYTLNETLYGDKITNNNYLDMDIFGNLINIEISNNGVYYASRPKIFIYGDKSNFVASPKIRYSKY